MNGNENEENEKELPYPVTVYDKHIKVVPVHERKGKAFAGCRLRPDMPKNFKSRFISGGERMHLSTVILSADAMEKLAAAVDDAIGKTSPDKSPVRTGSVTTECGKTLNVEITWCGDLDMWTVVMEVLNPLSKAHADAVEAYMFDEKNARKFADTLSACISTVTDWQAKLVMLNL